jgi:ppGpp synthetase/RelA/SpoT-type nucleotidyltranferase
VSLLPKTTLDFFDSYRARIGEYEDSAVEARDVVTRSLEGSGLGVHSISSRAKAPYSLLGKLREKKYSDPASQVTDLVGVRVITHYPDDAERAEEILRTSFDVNEEESYDRLDELKSSVFGYRSIHLVVRLPAAQVRLSRNLEDQWFEVQVRGLLQHAWAAVDHEVRYKSGIDFPPPLVRRFAAIAGGLEALDDAFMGMRPIREELTDSYRDTYLVGEDPDVRLDAARLTACMEAMLPEGRSMRGAAAVHEEYGSTAGKLAVEGLATVGVTTARQLREAQAGKKVRRLLKDHAAVLGTTVEQLSHLVVCIVVIWCENGEVLEREFPELRFDSALAETLGFEPA